MKKTLHALLLLLLCTAPLYALPKFPQRKQLESENERLRASIDSLKALSDSLREALAQERQAALSLLEAASEPQRPEPPRMSLESTDSLVGLWYKASLEDAGAPFPDSIETFTSDVPDSVMTRRLAEMNAYITIPFNGTVRNYMILYSEKRRESMGRIMGLSRYYFPIFEEALMRYGLPLELKYLSIVESMLNPVATSRAGARGIWQFIYSTARSYGLEVNSFVDERLDVEKAADAAARYLRDAYKVFGDWPLAISSYNCGPGNITKAIRRAGSRDFWSIYPYLPRETSGYLPAMVGAMYAMTYYREYGIEPREVGMPVATDTFSISRKLHFKQISEVVGIPLEDVQRLNPEYVHDIVPGTLKKPCTIRIPYDWTAAFVDANPDTLYTHRSAELLSPEVLKAADEAGASPSGRIVYKVRSGDYLGRIAARHHVSVKQIKNWNHLRSDNLRVGQILYIYR